MNNIRTVAERWRVQGIALHPPSDEQQIRSVLGAVGKPYADDVVQLYLITGGMAEERMDERCFVLWPLWKVRFENLQNRTPDIEFGDVFIDAFRLRLRPVDSATSAVFGGYDDRRLAGGIDEFFQLYVDDPRSLDLVHL